MAKKKQTPIKLSTVVADFKKVGKQSTYVLNEEKGEIIKYNEKFDRNLVEKLTLELFNDMQEAISKGYSYFENDEQLIKYELLLIIKYFSHFKDEIGETFEEKMTALEALSAIGLYDLFFDEIFDKDEVAEVVSRVNLVAEKAMIAQEIINKEKEK